MKDLFIAIMIFIGLSADWIVDSIYIYYPWLFNCLLIVGLLFIGYVLLIFIPRRIK